jgi:hypothetical protein
MPMVSLTAPKKSLFGITKQKAGTNGSKLKKIITQLNKSVNKIEEGRKLVSEVVKILPTGTVTFKKDLKRKIFLLNSLEAQIDTIATKLTNALNNWFPR